MFTEENLSALSEHFQSTFRFFFGFVSVKFRCFSSATPERFKVNDDPICVLVLEQLQFQSDSRAFPVLVESDSRSVAKQLEC